MADQPKSKFGGVPVDDGTASKFGGVAVSDQAKPVEPQRPGESRLAYLMRIPTHVDSSRIDAQMEADKADFRQIGEGVSSAIHANTADEAAGGASTALRGGMKIAAKALPALAPMMPVATVGGLVAGTAGSLVGQAGASAAGAGPGTSSLAGDIAGILAGGVGARLANAAAKILVHPSVLPKLIRILPKGQAMVDAATAIRDVARPPAPPAAPVAAPPAPASEAAMAQKAPAPLEPPTSRYTSTGEKKSPQLRAAEITGANAEAKAMRFAEALDKYDISPEDARQIQTGRVSTDQIGKGAAPKWENITDDLVAKGLLPAGEKPPVQSLPIIVKHLKRIRSERIARELADEMSKSGTSK